MVVLGGVGGELDDRCRLLNTLPPRSSTKWLCVATKAKAMESGVRSLLMRQPTILVPAKPARTFVLPPNILLFARFVRYVHR